MAARYNKVLDAAPEFAKREYPDVDVNEVAIAAGVATSTAYRYFPSSAHLLLALHRRQLLELRARVADRAAAARTDQQRARNLAGAAVEVFAMRLTQPAVNSVLTELVVPVEHELTTLILEVDELAWSLLGDLAGDAERGRSIVHMTAGLVSAVRTGRLMPYEAEQQLKASCEIVARRRAVRR